ncbi:hypothetical protein HYALB_00006027 [Hymenoscyphus albidus]|uniref:Involucrin repeat protein n=1 Tax=Hymenoscyphus albidus TaxID=595503 RepID=A0A9N9LZK6_9HELO|nr:hypothetical protein HYALB_00006027 [Hymenoscyphus albidus]
MMADNNRRRRSPGSSVGGRRTERDSRRAPSATIYNEPQLMRVESPPTTMRPIERGVDNIAYGAHTTYLSSSNSSSSSFELVDISRTFPNLRAGIKTFFTAPSERRKARRRRSSRLLKLNNSSSSSVNSDLAYGNGYIKRPKLRRIRSKSGKTMDRDSGRWSDRERERHRNNDGRRYSGSERRGYASGSDRKGNGSGSDRRGNTEAEILAVGAGLAKLAREQNKHDLRSRNGSRSQLVAVKETNNHYGAAALGAAGAGALYGASRGLASSKPSHEYDTSDDDGWESASDDESDDSVDSGLAFGDEAAGGWWGKAKHRPLSRKSTVVDPQLFGPENSLKGHVDRPVGFEEVAWSSSSDFGQHYHAYSESIVPNESVSGSQASLKHVFPVQSYGSPSRFEAARDSVASGSQPYISSRPGPAPLQPQPYTPVSQNLYDGPFSNTSEPPKTLKRVSYEGKSNSVAQAALAGVAGMAVGAAIASSRDDDRKDKQRGDDRNVISRVSSKRRDDDRDDRFSTSSRRRDDDHDDRDRDEYSRVRSKGKDSDKESKDERRRDQRDSPDRNERNDMKREKERRKDVSRYSDDERRERKRDKRRDDARVEAQQERREKRREERRSDNAPPPEIASRPEVRYDDRGARSEAAITAVSAIDPVMYRVADNAFPTPKISPQGHGRHDSVPKVVTVEREPEFVRTTTSSAKDAPSDCRGDYYKDTGYNGAQHYHGGVSDHGLHDAEAAYRDTSHSTAPIVAGAIGVAAAVVAGEVRRESRSEKRRSERRQRSEYNDTVTDYESKSRDREPERDTVQEEADRAYREIVMARKIASQVIRSRSASPDGSVVGRYSRKEEAEEIQIVTPPEMEHHKDKGPYDAPNADFQPDYQFDDPRQLHGFKDQLSSGYLKRDPDATKPRPLLNLVRPTPVPSPLPKKGVDIPEQSRSESSRSDSTRSESARTESTRTESTYTASTYTELNRSESGRSGTNHSDPPRSSKSRDRDDRTRTPVSDNGNGSRGNAMSSPATSTTSKGVTWGENETKHFDVESPSDHQRDDYMSSSDVPLYEKSPEPKQRSEARSDSKPSMGWGAIAAGVIGVGVGAAAASSDSSSKKSKSKENGRENSSPDAYEYRGVIVEPESPPAKGRRQASPPSPGPKPTFQHPHMPGGFGDDLEFTAHVAAGLKDTGFDPNIVIDDPSFRRRDSPPGSNERRVYQTPYVETVSDLTQIPVTGASTPGPGFVIGEVATTPQEWRSISPEGDNSTDKLSEKEQKKRDKAKRQSTDSTTFNEVPFNEETSVFKEPEPDRDDYFNEPKLSKKEQEKRDKEAKRHSNSAEDVTPTSEVLGARQIVDEPESYTETPKKSKKKSKRDSGAFDDDRGLASPSGSSIGRKSSIHSERYESPPRSAATSEISERERSSSRKKDKSRRHTDKYDQEPSTVSLPPSTPSETSQDRDLDDSRTSRKSSSRDNVNNDDEPRRKKSSSRSSTRDRDDFDDSRSVGSAASVPAGGEDSGKSKKKEKDKKGGFFGLFGSKSEAVTQDASPRGSKDDFDDVKSKKKKKRSSVPDVSSLYGDADSQSVGDLSRSSSRHRSHKYDDDEGARSDGERKKSRPRGDSSSSKRDSFLGNSGTLGAGAGLVGAAVAIAAHQQLKADEASGDESRKDHFERTGKRLTRDDELDPEITQRHIRPSIDPQYGDLLPLPPSEPATPENEDFAEFPSLPDSRPHTPEEKRIIKDRMKGSARKHMQETPAKSPSQSAVPINFKLKKGNRSTPTSPGFPRGVTPPQTSPATPPSDSYPFRRHSRRPTSWDSAKEFRPLYLPESVRRDSIIVIEEEEQQPLPELPASVTSSRSSSQANFEGALTMHEPFPDLSGRSKVPLSLKTDFSSEEHPRGLLDSQQSTPKARIPFRDDESDPFGTEFHNRDIVGGAFAGAALVGTAAYLASSSQEAQEDLPPPFEPTSKDSSSFLLHSSPISRRDDSSVDHNTDSPSRGKSPNFEDPPKSIEASREQALRFLTGETLTQDEPEAPLAKSKKGKEKEEKKGQLSRSSTQDDLSLSEPVVDADTVAAKQESELMSLLKKDMKKRKSATWEMGAPAPSPSKIEELMPDSSKELVEQMPEVVPADEVSTPTKKGKKKNKKSKSTASEPEPEPEIVGKASRDVHPELDADANEEFHDFAEESHQTIELEQPKPKISEVSSPSPKKGKKKSKRSQSSDVTVELLPSTSELEPSLEKNQTEISETPNVIQDFATPLSKKEKINHEAQTLETEESPADFFTPAESMTARNGSSQSKDYFSGAVIPAAAVVAGAALVAANQDESNIESESKLLTPDASKIAEQLTLAKQLREDFSSGSKKSKKDKKKRQSFPATPVPEQFRSRVVDELSDVQIRARSLSTGPATDGDRSKTVFSEDQLEFARQLKADFEKGSSKKSNKGRNKRQDSATWDDDIANQPVEELPIGQDERIPVQDVGHTSEANVLPTGYEESQLKLARQMKADFEKGNKKSKKDKKKRQETSTWDEEPPVASVEQNVPVSEVLPAPEATKDVSKPDVAPMVYDENQLSLARQMQADFTKKSKDEKGRSRSQTPQPKEPAEDYFGSSSQIAASEEPQINETTTSLEPESESKDPSHEGIVSRYDADQLELARQMKEDIAAAPLKKDKKNKKGKKRENLLQNPTGDDVLSQAPMTDELADPLNAEASILQPEATETSFTANPEDEFASTSKKSKKDKKGKKRDTSEPPVDVQKSVVDPPVVEPEMPDTLLAVDLVDGSAPTPKKSKTDKKGKKRDSVVSTIDDEISSGAAVPESREPVAEVSQSREMDTVTTPAEPEDNFVSSSEESKKGKTYGSLVQPIADDPPSMEEVPRNPEDDFALSSTNKDKKLESNIIVEGNLPASPATDDSELVRSVDVGEIVQEAIEITSVPKDDDISVSSSKGYKDEKSKKQESSDFHDQPPEAPAPEVESARETATIQSDESQLPTGSVNDSEFLDEKILKKDEKGKEAEEVPQEESTSSSPEEPSTPTETFSSIPSPEPLGEAAEVSGYSPIKSKKDKKKRGSLLRYSSTYDDFTDEPAKTFDVQPDTAENVAAITPSEVDVEVEAPSEVQNNKERGKAVIETFTSEEPMQDVQKSIFEEPYTPDLPASSTIADDLTPAQPVTLEQKSDLTPAVISSNEPLAQAAEDTFDDLTSPQNSKKDDEEGKSKDSSKDVSASLTPLGEPMNEEVESALPSQNEAQKSTFDEPQLGTSIDTEGTGVWDAFTSSKKSKKDKKKQKKQSLDSGETSGISTSTGTGESAEDILEPAVLPEAVPDKETAPSDLKLDKQVEVTEKSITQVQEVDELSAKSSKKNKKKKRKSGVSTPIEEPLVTEENVSEPIETSKPVDVPELPLTEEPLSLNEEPLAVQDEVASSSPKPSKKDKKAKKSKSDISTPIEIAEPIESGIPESILSSTMEELKKTEDIPPASFDDTLKAFNKDERNIKDSIPFEGVSELVVEPTPITEEVPSFTVTVSEELFEESLQIEEPIQETAHELSFSNSKRSEEDKKDRKSELSTPVEESLPDSAKAFESPAGEKLSVESENPLAQPVDNQWAAVSTQESEKDKNDETVLSPPSMETFEKPANSEEPTAKLDEPVVKEDVLPISDNLTEPVATPLEEPIQTPIEDQFNSVSSKKSKKDKKKNRKSGSSTLMEDTQYSPGQEASVQDPDIKPSEIVEELPKTDETQTSTTDVGSQPAIEDELALTSSKKSQKDKKENKSGTSTPLEADPIVQNSEPGKLVLEVPQTIESSTHEVVETPVEDLPSTPPKKSKKNKKKNKSVSSITTEVEPIPESSVSEEQTRDTPEITTEIAQEIAPEVVPEVVPEVAKSTAEEKIEEIINEPASKKSKKKKKKKSGISTPLDAEAEESVPSTPIVEQSPETMDLSVDEGALSSFKQPEKDIEMNESALPTSISDSNVTQEPDLVTEKVTTAAMQDVIEESSDKPLEDSEQPIDNPSGASAQPEIEDPAKELASSSSKKSKKDKKKRKSQISEEPKEKGMPDKEPVKTEITCEPIPAEEPPANFSIQSVTENVAKQEIVESRTTENISPGDSPRELEDEVGHSQKSQEGEGKMVTKDEVPDIEQPTSTSRVVDNDVCLSKEDPQVIEQSTTSTKGDLPALEDIFPVYEQPISISPANDNDLPLSEEDPPVVEQSTTSAKDDLPALEDVLPAINQPVLLVSDTDIATSKDMVEAGDLSDPVPESVDEFASFPTKDSKKDKKDDGKSKAVVEETTAEKSYMTPPPQEDTFEEAKVSEPLVSQNPQNMTEEEWGTPEKAKKDRNGEDKYRDNFEPDTPILLEQRPATPPPEFIAAPALVEEIPKDIDVEEPKKELEPSSLSNSVKEEKKQKSSISTPLEEAIVLDEHKSKDIELDIIKSQPLYAEPAEVESIVENIQDVPRGDSVTEANDVLPPATPTQADSLSAIEPSTIDPMISKNVEDEKSQDMLETTQSKKIEDDESTVGSISRKALKKDKRKRQASTTDTVVADEIKAPLTSWANDVEEAEVEREVPVIQEIAVDESLSHIAKSTEASPVDDFVWPNKKGRKWKKQKSVDMSRAPVSFDPAKNSPTKDSNTPIVATASTVLAGAALIEKLNEKEVEPAKEPETPTTPTRKLTKKEKRNMSIDRRVPSTHMFDDDALWEGADPKNFEEKDTQEADNGNDGFWSPAQQVEPSLTAETTFEETTSRDHTTPSEDGQTSIASTPPIEKPFSRPSDISLARTIAHDSAPQTPDSASSPRSSIIDLALGGLNPFRRSRLSGMFDLPAVEEENILESEHHPAPHIVDSQSANRDSGFVTTSPVPLQGSFADDHGRIRDSGVHMRDFSPAPEPVSTSDAAISRLPWPEVDEETETVDLKSQKQRPVTPVKEKRDDEARRSREFYVPKEEQKHDSEKKHREDKSHREQEFVIPKEDNVKSIFSSGPSDGKRTVHHDERPRSSLDILPSQMERESTRTDLHRTSAIHKHGHGSTELHHDEKRTKVELLPSKLAKGDSEEHRSSAFSRAIEVTPTPSLRHGDQLIGRDITPTKSDKGDESHASKRSTPGSSRNTAEESIIQQRLGRFDTPELPSPSRSKGDRQIVKQQRSQSPEVPVSSQPKKQESYAELRHLARPKAEQERTVSDNTIAAGVAVVGAAGIGFAAARQLSQEKRSSSAASQKSISNINRLRTPNRSDSVNSSSNRSGTPPLRRSDRKVAGDLRSLSQRSQADLAKEAELAALTSTSPANATNTTTPANPTANEGRVRAKEMADVYDGVGEGRMGSPRSPTRPHSMRRRQSMQVLDLESKVEQLAAENRMLAEAKAQAERTLQSSTNTASSLVEKDAEIDSLKRTLDWLTNEVSRLTEVNAGLTSANVTIGNQQNERYSQLESQHAQTSRELQEVRDAHKGLSDGMEAIVITQVKSAVQEKDQEIANLRAELEETKNKIREMQAKILLSKSGDIDFLTVRDEDYFESTCEKLCLHVQQWVLRFSKFSDMRACRLTTEINNDKTIDRLDNAILDGSDVDSYLTDRVKRRDVFMSMTMTMVWEFIFTRYLFGMDREQRQKLKSLEKLLSEVGPAAAVHQWRATTLTLLSKRESFIQQRGQDTQAVVHAILETLSEILPPPSHLEAQIEEQLTRVIKSAVDLSIEMRTQRAEYMMLPPLQPEYDANGDLASKVSFNAALMNERSGDTISNDTLEKEQAVVRVVLFPLVVKKGDDRGEGDEEIVVCPAQVLVAKAKRVRMMSPGRNISKTSMQSSMPADYNDQDEEEQL